MGKLLWQAEVRERERLLSGRSCSFDSRRTCSQGHGHKSSSAHKNISPENLEVLEQVGEGGFAVVNRCKLQVPGKVSEIVAAKRLKPDSFRRDREFLDFVAEMLLMSRLSHPHIVQFVGLVEDGLSGTNGAKEGISVVEEYMNMGSLRDQVLDVMSERKSPYLVSSGMRWMLQVAYGLQYLHGLSATVIHRDLKPENILLTRDHLTGDVVVKIADFGLSAVIARHNRSLSTDCQELDEFRSSGGIRARRSFRYDLEGVHQQNAERTLKHNSTTSSIRSNNIMRSSTLLLSVFDPRNSKQQMQDLQPVGPDVFHDLSGRTGSLMYMAPEVLANKRYNEKVDVYSFGIILYEVMARCKLVSLFVTPGTPGQFAAQRVKQYSESVMNGFRPPVPLHWPIGVRTLVQDCWQHDPRDRPSIAQAAARLKTALKVQIAKEQSEDDARRAGCVCCAIM